ETEVSTLAAINSTSGNIQVDNDSALLTVGTVGLLVGVNNDNTSDAGVVAITNARPLTIANDVISDGDVTLSATDSSGTGVDNLVINTLMTVTSNLGGVTLNAGDNVSIPEGATVQA